jgi:homoserine kinase
LGSSATAIVGGLLGANNLAGNPLSQAEIMQMAIAIEGHPDNVVPALLGNCLLSVEDHGAWQISQIPWHQDIIPIVAIPNFELSTREAREVLPTEYSRSDAIFNISRMGLLIRALETNNPAWLKTALADKLHQPYRQKLITGYQQVEQAAIAAGAYGMVISGAGPTLLALASPERVEQVVKSMTAAWNNMDIESQVRSLAINPAGAKVE